MSQRRKMPELNEKVIQPGGFGAKFRENHHESVSIIPKKKVPMSKRPELIPPNMSKRKYRALTEKNTELMKQVPGNGQWSGKLRDFMNNLMMKENLVTADPVEMLIYIAVTGKDPLDEARNVVDEEDRRIPLTLRIECARATARFVRPTVSQIDIHTMNSNQAKDASDVVNEELMMDPEVRRAYEEIQIKLSGQISEGAEEMEE